MKNGKILLAVVSGLAISAVSGFFVNTVNAQTTGNISDEEKNVVTNDGNTIDNAAADQAGSDGCGYCSGCGVKCFEVK